MFIDDGLSGSFSNFTLSNVAEIYGITPPIELIRRPPPTKESFKEYVITKMSP